MGYHEISEKQSVEKGYEDENEMTPDNYEWLNTATMITVLLRKQTQAGNSNNNPLRWTERHTSIEMIGAKYLWHKSRSTVSVYQGNKAVKQSWTLKQHKQDNWKTKRIKKAILKHSNASLLMMSLHYMHWILNFKLYIIKH